MRTVHSLLKYKKKGKKNASVKPYTQNILISLPSMIDGNVRVDRTTSKRAMDSATVSMSLELNNISEKSTTWSGLLNKCSGDDSVMRNKSCVAIAV
jgi:hypothetical protein